MPATCDLSPDKYLLPKAEVDEYIDARLPGYLQGVREAAAMDPDARQIEYARPLSPEADPSAGSPDFAGVYKHNFLIGELLRQLQREFAGRTVFRNYVTKETEGSGAVAERYEVIILAAQH